MDSGKQLLREQVYGIAWETAQKGKFSAELSYSLQIVFFSLFHDDDPAKQSLMTARFDISSEEWTWRAPSWGVFLALVEDGDDKLALTSLDETSQRQVLDHYCQAVVSRMKNHYHALSKWFKVTS